MPFGHFALTPRNFWDICEPGLGFLPQLLNLIFDIHPLHWYQGEMQEEHQRLYFSVLLWLFVQGLLGQFRSSLYSGS